MRAGNNAPRIISRTSPMAMEEGLREAMEEGLREHVILGIDARDIHAQKDRWLAENPYIKIIETDHIKREPPSLLVRFGGRCVPRFSMLLRYREEVSRPEAATGISVSPAAAQSKTKKNR
jgi:hypothetical protein